METTIPTLLVYMGGVLSVSGGVVYGLIRALDVDRWPGWPLRLAGWMAVTGLGTTGWIGSALVLTRWAS